MSRLHELRRKGFDESAHVPFTRTYRVKCSCCAALVINGIAAHERGCPNQTSECEECGDTIPGRQRLCESCAEAMYN